MPSIFQTRPGVAVAFPSVEDVPIPIAFDGWSGSTFPQYKSIITQMAIERNGNYQFLHTLKDLIYVYVFGERIGTITISGISFAGSCQPATSGRGSRARTDTKTGIEHILEYYEQNSIARRSTPITIQIGANTSGHFTGFLTNLRVNILQPEARMAQFAFQFQSFPRAMNREGGES